MFSPFFMLSKGKVSQSELGLLLQVSHDNYRVKLPSLDIQKLFWFWGE